MALSLDTLVEYAKRRILAGMPDGSPWADIDMEIAANVTAASNLAATRVMRNPLLRPRLQQVYSITLDGSGVGDLSTANGSITTTADEILVEGIYLGSVVNADGIVVVPLPHYTDFISPQFTVFPYYHVNEQKKILTRSSGNQVFTANDVQGLSGNLSIRASYNPGDVAQWPAEIQNDLINALCELTLAKVPGAAPATA